MLSAKSGRDACPSCEIELARRTENGTRPLAYSVINIKCGPDSGIRPINIAINISNGNLFVVNEVNNDTTYVVLTSLHYPSVKSNPGGYAAFITKRAE